MYSRSILVGLYNSVLEYCDDLIMAIDLDFKIIAINSMAENVFNVSRKKVVGQNLFEICKNEGVELSFTKEELVHLKSIGYKSFKGHILLPNDQKRIMLWKQIFTNGDQKRNNYFLILGRDISALEKYKRDASLITIYLNNILKNLPEYIYWKDSTFHYLGCNKHVANYLNLPTPQNIVGKTDEDFGWAKERVLALRETDKKIIKTGITDVQEEIIPRSDGSKRVMLSSKSPLVDDDNSVIGIVGVSVDITDYKKMKRLVLETEVQKAKLQEQEVFRKVVDQVVHDIRSPLASLQIMVKTHMEEIPEHVRTVLRDIAISIGDVANNLLCKYKDKDKDSVILITKKRQPVIISLIILQILSEKRHQYKELPVKFKNDFCPECNFAFIKTDAIAFKRMLSNLINNAVDALDGKRGEVKLKLEMDDDQHIKLIVQDNGKGMPQEVISKIKKNIPVTTGKKHGYGIGFIQIMEAIKKSKGELKINSKIGKGTEITITFPTVKSPNWVAKEIKLNQGDTVVVLDDDSSIHHAWKNRIKRYCKYVNLKHFTMGEDAIDFINNFPEKGRLFLLADFELLKQELNGLHVIERTNIRRSILVTSHYANPTVCKLAVKNNTKILPKPLAPEVPITIKRNFKDNKGFGKYKSRSRKVDVVFIDDDQMFIDSVTTYFKRKNKIVDKYYNPSQFLEKLPLYAKNTLIFMDNTFQGNIGGIELAKQLHKNGYTRLYLLSGKDFKRGEIPGYLTIIAKTDIDKLLSFVK